MKFQSTGIKKKLQTQLGEIEVSKGHILEPKASFRQSPFLQETVLYLGQNQTFNESSLLLEKLCGIELSDKQTEHLCHYYGEKIECNFTNNETVSSEKKNELHYVMVDGSYVLSREESWIETKVGRVFKAHDNFKVSEKRSVIKESEYIAHIGTHTDFIAKISPILDKLNNTIFIADGAPWMWKWVGESYPNTVQILDFFHAYEKICQWAILAFKDKALRSDWRDQIKKLLLNDEVKEVILQIQNIDCQGDTLEKRDALLTYLENNANRMMYKTNMEKGYLIGSGAIESAQRTVVQQRVKRSGQRWTIKGGQQVLNLRTKNLSNRWNEVIQLVRNAA